MSQPALLTLSRTASVVGGLLWACLAPVFVYGDSAVDKAGTAAFALAVTSMWLVGVVSLVLLLLGLGQFWSLCRDRLGGLGVAGVAVSAFALAALALGNGIELTATQYIRDHRVQDLHVRGVHLADFSTLPEFHAWTILCAEEAPII
jgi:hypothetical protein